MASASTNPSNLPVIPSEQLTKLNEYPVALGGYGQVFRCIMRSPAAPEALVAVKVLMCPTGDASKLKHARREMTLWMEAKHDNIVPMLGITDGFSDGGFAMVSPWIEGGTLARYLEVHAGTIHSRKKLTLLQDTARGLVYLHSRKIVHGDLTTNNIMLNYNGKAMLIDFGLSHVLEGIDGSCLTPSPARPGAVRFAAPELLGAEGAIVGQSTGEDSPVDFQSPMPNVRSDIYSLGCVMLAVLAEQLPWHRHRNMAFLGDLHARKPIPIPAHNHISEERRKFICECTSFQASRRPCSQSVVDFIEKELHVEDALEQSMLEVSSRDDLPFAMHKLDTEMPIKVTSTSIQQPSVDPCGQIHCHSDDITILSESPYSTCLTSMLDDSHDGASSRTRNAPTATQRTDPGTPVLIGDVSTTTEMPNNNCPPVLINSPRRELNIVVAGAIGSGKSSLVNLLSGERVAQTSINAGRCTGEWMGYRMSFCNNKYRVFDTVGFACGNGTSLGHKELPEKYEDRQIEEIYERKSIDLVLLCVPIRNFRVQTALDVHKRIQDQVHGRHVPVVAVFTHFEERSIIDRWWSKNSSTLQAQLNSITNHICITSIDEKCFDESRNHIFQIIAQYCISDAGEPREQKTASGGVHSGPPPRNVLGSVAWVPRIKQFSARVCGAVTSGLGLRPLTNS